MIKRRRSDPFENHTLVFSIQQRNIDTLEQIVNDRSDPHSPNYQQWLSVEEIQTMTVNMEGFDHVMQWLRSNRINNVTHTPSYHFITASAPISLWESLFDIQFYEWHHHNSDSEKPVTVHRSEELKLPNSMLGHVFTVFNTCQAMPVIKHHRQIRSAEGKPLSKTHMVLGDVPGNLRSRISRRLTAPTSVNIVYLDNYYSIANNIGEIVVACICIPT